MRMLPLIITIVGGLAMTAGLALVIATAIGTRQFQALYETKKADLLQRGRATAPGTINATAISRLPSPVRKYLQVTRTVGKPGMKVAVLKQRGALRAAADQPWMPFEAEQAYAMEPPGFVWMANAQFKPLVPLLARDTFIDGKGNMLIRLLGLITVADGKGPEMDQGAGLRHWGEIIAFPEAVTSPHLRWEAIGDSQARMMAEHDGLTMTAVVDFDAQGYPSGFHAERYRDVNGKGALTPWSGYCRQWKTIDGRMFPTQWTSVWHTPEGDLEAVRMETLSVVTE
jgi:hypothetical protein